jgi:hypothetical protein
MRLHLAEEQRTFTPLPEIEAALEYWREINSRANKWATFEAINFSPGLVIRVKVGYTFHKGTKKEFKEEAYKTRSFYVTPDGEVSFVDIVHN